MYGILRVVPRFIELWILLRLNVEHSYRKKKLHLEIKNPGQLKQNNYIDKVKL